MPAPLIIPFIAGLLTVAGAHLAPAAAVAVKTEAVAAGVYAQLPKICAGLDPLIDALQRSRPGSAALVRLAAAADAACLAAKQPNTIGDQLALVIKTIQAVQDANRKLGGSNTAATPPEPASNGPALIGRGIWRAQ